MNLFAAGDWEALIKVGVFLVIIGYSIINQIVSAARKAQQKPKPPEARPLPPKMPPVEKANPRQQQLHDEVEEFLRRAAERKGTAAPQLPSPPLPSKRPRINVELPPKPAPLQRSTSKAAKQPGKTPVAKQLPEPADRLAPGGFEDHISGRHLATRVGTLSTHEQAFDTQIGQDFNRSVGTLAPNAAQASVTAVGASAEPQQSVPADAIAAALRSPQSVRDAIVLSEILTRPEHRW
ncbi:MAG TPA: hypothetical protein VG713_20825 [Pirellulales bacterium]|nr:hypothetical protein [Pirellulales bacterium]